jgi:hypothetical protein
VILLLSLLNRLFVFFKALENLGPGKMLDFVEVIPLFLISTAPFIVGDALDIAAEAPELTIFLLPSVVSFSREVLRLT